MNDGSASPLFKSQVFPWSLTFRSRKTEADFQRILCAEVLGYGRITFAVVTFIWLGLGLTLLVLSRLIPTKPAMAPAFFMAGFIIFVWRRLTAWAYYFRVRNRVELGAYTVLTICGAVIIASLPARYQQALFGFLVLAALAPHSFSQLPTWWSLATGLAVSGVVIAFAIMTGSYPAAEGGMFLLFLYLGMTNIIGLSVSRFTNQQRRLQYFTSKMLDTERELSDRLLNALFPSRIAGELRMGLRIDPVRLEDVSVVFCDLSGFTAWSATADPKLVLHVLDDLFSRFDAIAAELNLDKIKTIGDGYMACSNLTTRSLSATSNAVVFASRALAALAEIGSSTNGGGTPTTLPLRLRVGIATGSVVAGVIGTSKPTYDVWGETVNLASRLESSADPGTIRLCEQTFAGAKDVLQTAARDAVIDLKGFGQRRTFSVGPY